MTPFFEEDKYQPFSRVSVAALADLGYKVNLNAADPLTLDPPEINSTSHGNQNARMLKDVAGQRPSKTFTLDSSNILVPDVQVIEYIL